MGIIRLFRAGNSWRVAVNRTCSQRNRSRIGSPWEPARFSLYPTIFPQMTLFLPEDEASQLRFTFETVLARLKTA